MGQQQLLLIILGVIIVGIAIAVGLSMFSSQSISSNKDAIINDLNNLFANAYQYRIRPASMGGGGGSYAGYKIPATLSENENGTYVTTPSPVTDPNAVVFAAVSTQDSNRTVTVTIDQTGRPQATSWTYGGDFL
ncbi:MAG: hypothetical protein L0Y80_05925 [Ignavibacteriae bacterium]|nr:hypothetical protein [Ignavibacteriota bacterium]